MKIVAFSDLHVHPHPFGAGINPATGRHSRLQDTLDVLDWTGKLAQDAKAHLRVFCGDMFHVRGRLAPSVLNPVLQHFERRDANCPIDVLLVGNHDMEHNADGEHALEWARTMPRCVVLDGFGYRTGAGAEAIYGDVGVGWVAYTPFVALLKDRLRQVAAQAALDDMSARKILLVHHGVDGAMPDIPDCGFGPRDLPTSEFDVTLCGDYHNHKELVAGKAWMIGAPLQHNFGDQGEKRGCMTLDLSGSTVDAVHVENEAAPKFATWAIDAAGNHQAIGLDPASGCKNRFMRLRAPSEEMLQQMEEAAKKQGARACRRELVREFKAMQRSDVSLSMTTAQMFRSWLDKEEVGDLDKEELALLNDDVLREAGVA